MNATLDKALVRKELIKRELMQKYESERNSLYAFIKSYWALERKENLVDNRHIKLICEKLEAVHRGEIKRLIINIPPRSLKTEIVSKAYPVWSMGNQPSKKFMAISYSASLSQDNSWGARDMYMSDTYLFMFPDRPEIKADQNTKEYWRNTEWWHYYASGSTGSITGKWCDDLIIDDPINPKEATSEVMRNSVNKNYFDTLRSRLNDQVNGAIIIIMQRVHDDDLTGHLIEKMREWTWEVFDVLSIPAIAVEDDEYRKVWESFFEARFPITMLHTMKAQDAAWFSTQYQQNPVDIDSQEFSHDWYRYHSHDWDFGKETPKNWRIFTAVDPAFKTNQYNDETSIITWKFIGDELYILEITHWRFNPATAIDKMVYHIKKRSPEKIGIESYQAQTLIADNLKNTLTKMWLYTTVEEISQSWDKEAKIRKLIPLYRNWLIFHKQWMDTLEYQLARFPRGKHDDIIDSLQMLYDMYSLQPNSTTKKQEIKLEYDANWIPFIV